MTVEVLQGDCRAILPTLPERSVQCCITSPPFFGLRSYLPAGHPDKRHEIGAEPAPAEFVAALVEVFAGVWRVLRDDGVLFLELGDSYGGVRGNLLPAPDNKHPHAGADTPGCGKQGTQRKNLLGIPWRVAFALQDAGWILRSEIIWARPNPMPESVQDRVTRSHSTVFMFAKQARYYYDAPAIAEPAQERCHAVGKGSRMDNDRDPAHGTSKQDAVGKRTYTGFNERWRARVYPTWEERKANGAAMRRGDPGESGDVNHGAGVGGNGITRNARSVWTIATQPYPGSHFAVFPEALAERCLLAGTSAYGACPECGAPWRRVTSSIRSLDENRPQARRALEIARERGLTAEHIEAIGAAGITDAGKAMQTQSGTGKNTEHIRALAAEAKEALGGYYREFTYGQAATTGWEPTCKCGRKDVVPCRVLEPFAGSGTVGRVATRHGRDAVLIDLSTEYLSLIDDRTSGVQQSFASVL